MPFDHRSGKIEPLVGFPPSLSAQVSQWIYKSVDVSFFMLRR